LEKRNRILEVEEIHTYYGESHVIQGLSMHVAEKEAVSILGRNGVGKTTTLRSIMGLTPSRHGRISIDGEDTTRWPARRYRGWAWPTCLPSATSFRDSLSRRT